MLSMVILLVFACNLKASHDTDQFTDLVYWDTV